MLTRPQCATMCLIVVVSHVLTRPTVCHIVSYCGGVTCVDTATVCHSVSYCGGVTCVDTATVCHSVSYCGGVTCVDTAHSVPHCVLLWWCHMC